MTRRFPDGRLAAGGALVDRTCFGIKDAYLDGPLDQDELDELIDRWAEIHGGMEEIDAVVAQSIAYHAIDYGRRCGFEPHRDFPEKVFGPRPAVLADTPWRAAERPIYVSGPHDDVGAILEQLERRVGPDGFDFIDGEAMAAEELLAAEGTDLDELEPIDVEAVVKSTTIVKP